MMKKNGMHIIYTAFFTLIYYQVTIFSILEKKVMIYHIINGMKFSTDIAMSGTIL